MSLPCWAKRSSYFECALQRQRLCACSACSGGLWCLDKQVCVCLCLLPQCHELSLWVSLNYNVDSPVATVQMTSPRVDKLLLLLQNPAVHISNSFSHFPETRLQRSGALPCQITITKAQNPTWPDESKALGHLGSKSTATCLSPPNYSGRSG